MFPKLFHIDKIDPNDENKKSSQNGKTTMKILIFKIVYSFVLKVIII